MDDAWVGIGSAGRRLLTAAVVPAELAALLADAARAVTGAPYAFATVAGAAASSGEDVGGAMTAVTFDGGSVEVCGRNDAQAALRELAEYAVLAVPCALERERRRGVNTVVRHDVRTAIGIGKGFVSMLERHLESMTPKQRTTALTGLHDALDRLDVHMRRALTDEQLQVDDPAPRRGAISVAAVLAAVGSDHPGVVVDIDQVAPGRVHADPLMLREILDNLVANAVAVAPDGTPVTLSVTADESFVTFAVHDLGPGFTPEDRAILFERYGRTERSRAGRMPGLGLGLSIVRRLVTAHGGSYGVTGGHGDGTTVWVAFPRD